MQSYGEIRRNNLIKINILILYFLSLIPASMSRKFARICNDFPGLAAARRNMDATRDCQQRSAIVGNIRDGRPGGSPSRGIDIGAKAGTLEESPFGAWVTVQPATLQYNNGPHRARSSSPAFRNAKDPIGSQIFGLS